MNPENASKLRNAFVDALERDPLSVIATALDQALPGWDRGLPGVPISPFAKVSRDPRLADALKVALEELDASRRAAASEFERTQRAERDKLSPIMKLVPFGDPHAPEPIVDPIAAEKRYRAVLEANPDLAARARGDFLTNCWLAEIFIKSACKVVPLPPHDERAGHRQYQDDRCNAWLRNNGWCRADHLTNFYEFLVAAIAAAVPMRRGSGSLDSWFGLELPKGIDFRPSKVRVA
jgi:hypothetical protein